MLAEEGNNGRDNGEDANARDLQTLDAPTAWNLERYTSTMRRANNAAVINYDEAFRPNVERVRGMVGEIDRLTAELVSVNNPTTIIDGERHG